MRAISRSMLPLAAFVGLLSWTADARGQAPKASAVSEGTRNGQWPSYTGDVRGSRYSPLDQINAANFKDLEVAWRFKTDSLGTRPEYKLEGTPLVVNRVLYTTAGKRRAVIAHERAHVAHRDVLRRSVPLPNQIRLRQRTT